MMSRKLMAMLLAVVMLAVALAGCAKQAAAPAESVPAPEAAAAPTMAPIEDTAAAPETTTDETLRVLLESEPESLDPLHISSSYVFAPMSTACFMLLVYADEETGEPGPGLATAWEWIDDTHLRLTIRDDVYTSGGTKIVASDILYSFQAGKSGTSASFFGQFDTDNFVVESETSIIIALTKSYPHLIEVFENPCMIVFSEAEVEKLGVELTAINDLSTLCTGKYVFSEWVPAQYITLVRNENYCDKDDMPYFGTIRCTFNNDSSARAMALQSDDCDVASTIALNQLATLEAEGFKTNARDTDDIISIYFNCSIEPFDNELVRKAISLAINRDAIRAVLYSGYGSVIQAPFSSASPYYEEYTGSVDIEGAKAALAESGVKDITFKLNTLPNTLSAAEVLQANLAEIGITMEINALDFGAYIGARKSGDYEATIGLVGTYDYATLLNAYDGRLTPDIAFGGAQYKDDALCALIDKALVEKDFAARVAAVHEVSQYLIDHSVSFALCSVARCDPCKSDLSGMRFRTASFVDVSGMYRA